MARRRLGPRARALAAAGSAAIFALLATARGLRPDPRGFGTHERLGLHPCLFRSRFGLPCPSCGMTTSWAWLMRGDPGDAWRASPAGALLLPAAAVLMVWLLVAATRGRAPLVDSPAGLGARLAAWAAVLIFGAWLIRLVLNTGVQG